MVKTTKVVLDTSTPRSLVSGTNNYEPDSELFDAVWKPKIKAYNDKLRAAIPKEWLVPDELIPEDLDVGHFNATDIPAKVLDKETMDITSLTAVDLAKKIACKELTSLKVITAFAKRASIAHQLTNCAMEIFFDEAFERAKSLDEYLEKNGKTIGPFHGVPLSLKEHYSYAGHVTHGGFVCSLENVTPEFSLTNQILYDLGAVFYIRTTQPQCLMHLDSINNITGRGKNCYKTSMSPGGSSSGEGSLIGMRGSPLGVGSDIGGSIRAPAAFNGIYGLKPSSKRIALTGVYSPSESTHSDIVAPTLGPMANSIDDLEFFMEQYLSTKPWEKECDLIPIPWRSVPKPVAKDLKIAIVFDDGVVKPHPPVLRALKQVESKLIGAGVQVSTWEPFKVFDVLSVGYNGFTADGGYGYKLRLEQSGEPLAPLSDIFLRFGQGSKGLSVAELDTLAYVRDVLKAQYHALFKERDVDFILAPTYVGTAPKPSEVTYWGYTLLWNVLDMSSVVIPSGVFASKDLDLKDLNYKSRNEWEEHEYGLYDAEASDGLPIGLTLIGKRFTEEALLKAGKVIDEILKST